MGISGAPKKIRMLLRACEKQGCHVQMTGGGHYKITGVGWVVMVSNSPKDIDTCVLQARRDLRKRGLVV